jgi:transposase InsO family protein
MVKITQDRILQATAYLQGQRPTRPDWLPANTVLRNGKLYTGKAEIVPWEDRNIYIAEFYNSPLTTGGRDRVYPRLRQKYYGISRQSVSTWLENNETHQLHQPLPKRQTTRRIVVKGPDRVAQIDLVDLKDLKGFNGQKRYMLTYVDLFSKWIAARAITTKTAAKVQEALLDILRDTNISTLQSDNGAEFGPSLEKKLSSMDIKLIHSSPYKPTTQGAIERVNGMLKRTLYRLMDANDTKKWTEMLQDVVTNHNTSVHSVTGWKPADLQKAELTEDEIEAIQKKMRGPAPTVDEKGADFKKGDTVRLALTVHAHERKKGAFRKGYKVNWSTDLFEITSVSEPEAENAQPQYMVKNLTTNRS